MKVGYFAVGINLLPDEAEGSWPAREQHGWNRWFA
jgi:hypothetical protein